MKKKREKERKKEIVQCKHFFYKYTCMSNENNRKLFKLKTFSNFNPIQNQLHNVMFCVGEL